MESQNQDKNINKIKLQQSNSPLYEKQINFQKKAQNQYFNKLVQQQQVTNYAVNNNFFTNINFNKNKFSPKSHNYLNQNQIPKRFYPDFQDLNKDNNTNNQEKKDYQENYFLTNKNNNNQNKIISVKNNVLNFNSQKQQTKPININLNLGNLPLKPNTAHISGRYRSPKRFEQNNQPLLRKNSNDKNSKSPQQQQFIQIQNPNNFFKQSYNKKQQEDIYNHINQKNTSNNNSFLLKQDSLEKKLQKKPSLKQILDPKNNDFNQNKQKYTYYNENIKGSYSDRQHLRKNNTSPTLLKNSENKEQNHKNSLKKNKNNYLSSSEEEDSTKEDNNQQKNLILKFAQTTNNFNNTNNQDNQNIQNNDSQNDKDNDFLNAKILNCKTKKKDSSTELYKDALDQKLNQKTVLKNYNQNTFEILRQQEMKKMELEYQLQMQRRPKTTDQHKKYRNNQNTEKDINSVIGATFYSGGPTNLDRYEFGPIIGQGSYAVVRYAKDKQTNKKVAIKTYDKFKLMDPQKRNNVKREISNLQRLKHQNIIKLYMTVDTRTTVNLVMEYIGNISLRQYLKNQPKKKIQEDEAKNIFKQLIESLLYCHENFIAHRDIKLENMLIQDGNLKLIDFGFSIKIQDDKKLNVFCGTPSYMSPEIILKKEYIGKFADIWSCGVLLFVLLLGKFPFKGKDDNELYKKIIKCDYKIVQEDKLSLEVTDLLNKLLVYTPTDRLTASQILQHKWLN